MAYIRELSGFRRPGIPEQVRVAYNDTLKTGAEKIWRGFLQVAASGFGKGLLAVIAIATIGTAMAYGFNAYAVPMFIGKSIAAATVGEGMMYGLGVGLEFLTRGIGVLAMLAGGAIGGVIDVRGAQNKLTTEAAQAQALEYARLRGESPAKTQAPEKTSPPKMEKDFGMTMTPPPEVNFIERELGRRPQGSGLGR